MGDEVNQKFEWALKNGDIDQVKVVVEKNEKEAGFAGKPLPNGRYPLCIAADYGQKDIIDYLISKGAKVNVEDKYGISPLLSAIYEGHTECVKLLLQKGANKSGKGPDGSSYIDCAEKDEIKVLLK